VVLAALAALLRGSRRTAVRAAWVVALVGLAVAGVLARLAVAVPGGADAVPVWPGAALQVAAAGLLAAAVLGGEGARDRLARASFGWRQPVAAATALLAAAAPLLLAGAWVARGADDPLRRDLPALLPAFAEAELAATPCLRVLSLAPRADGTVAYELASARGARLDTALTPPAPAQVAGPRRRRRRPAVAAGEHGGAGPGDPRGPLRRPAARAGGRGARRRPRPAGRADPPVGGGRAAVARGRLDGPADRAVAAGRCSGAGRGAVPAGAGARRAAAARGRRRPPRRAAGARRAPARARGGDRPRLDRDRRGRPLERRTAHGWAQAFALPAEGGEVVVARDEGPRRSGCCCRRWRSSRSPCSPPRALAAGAASRWPTPTTTCRPRRTRVAAAGVTRRPRGRRREAGPRDAAARRGRAARQRSCWPDRRPSPAVGSGADRSCRPAPGGCPARPSSARSPSAPTCARTGRSW
jgi:hypothetical protein